MGPLACTADKSRAVAVNAVPRMLGFACLIALIARGYA